jgi:large subunit ribosomal protein L6
MSRIGRKPIDVPKGIEITVQGNLVKGKGPAGELSVTLPPVLEAKLDGGRLELRPRGDDPALKSLHGTYRTVVANMVQGLQKPFVKELEIQGVGFKAQAQGQKVVLALGFSHPVELTAPAGVAIKVTDGTLVTVSGPSKQLVGQVSALIRGYFPAEPYKGKGVRYKGEHIRRKAGKAVA